MPDRLLVPARVIPRAAVDRAGGLRAGRLVVRVRAVPVGGAANAAAVRAIARALGVREADVRIERGSAAREKVFSVPAAAGPALAALMK
ncbi:MAG: DUF167 domain-containing protein [Chloroflexi bacterium]|nr:MAG: DUF167 domain-containing protein [Chloroflexota bacterium]TMG71938.1 MAG: DUF167 domain-containing protein [Chloroflexota bacterium]